MRDRGATRALVLGLLALPFGVFAPLAVWSGIRSLQRIRESGGELTGGASAMGGVLAGWLGLVTLLLWIGYWLLAS